MDRNKKTMITGTVKLFHSSKGYGLIRQDTGGRDVFVHHSAVQIAGLTDLRKGQKLSFEIFDNQGKLAAKNLRIHGVLGNPSQDSSISSEVTQNARCEMSPKTAERTEVERTPITRTALEAALAEAEIGRAHV